MAKDCPRCHKKSPRRLFAVVRPDLGADHVCLSCALKDGGLLLRSARIALVVGSFLTLLNQGDSLTTGPPYPEALWWKVPITYLVPFSVATYSALTNARRANSASEGGMQ